MNKNKDNKQNNNVECIDYTDFDEPLYKFHDGKLLKGIYEYGFEKPSIIQSKCFKPMENGVDLIAQAQSGSGKTGAFVIGVLMKIDLLKRVPQGIIIANTRELAMQIYDVMMEIAKFLPNFKATLCIGGIEQMNNRIEYIIKEAERSHVLVCTPGRLNNLIRDSYNLLTELKILVIDEADQLLSEDFLDQLKFILGNIPSKTQICLFSATTNSKNIQNTKKCFMKDMVELYIPKENIKVDKIENYIIDAEKEYNKYNILVDLYKKMNICQCVIFVNTIDKSIELSKKLKKDGHEIGLIHGKLNSNERMEILKKFRKTQIRTIVATDIIARGIDIQQVGLVINYDIPIGNNFSELYLHRVGRSGRYGKFGVAINIMTNDENEWNRIQDISINYKINFKKMPSIEEVNYFLVGNKC